MRLATAVGVALAVLASSQIARAQHYEEVDSLYGLQLSAGAGVVDFSADAAAHLTKIGQLWDACLLVGTDQFVAFEASYTGTSNPFNQVMAPFVPNTSVIGSSLEGDFRMQLPRWLTPAQPYGFVGIGWNNFWLTNPTHDPVAVSRTDNMVMFTFGGGVQGYLTRHFTLDARFTYRDFIGENLLHTSASGQPGVQAQSMNQWAFSARVGYAF
jgi:opacity protein-like surface antigen